MENPKVRSPHRIKTPDSIEIKFGTVDYVGEGIRHAKFYANPSKPPWLLDKWVKYTPQIFIYSYTYTVLSTHPQVRNRFSRAMPQMMRSQARFKPFVVKKLNTNI